MTTLSRTDGEPGQVRTVAIDRPRASTLKLRLINLAAVIIPFVGLLVGIALLWGFAFNWVHLALLAVMYLVSTLGVAVGYHRYFTHRSFKTPRPIAAFLAIMGSMAAEGPVIQWAALHRRHHQFSDEPDDPHSPHTHGAGIWGAVRGLWHAHVGWLFLPRPHGLARYAEDLRSDPLVRWMSRLFLVWLLIGLALPALLGGLFTLSWSGVLLGFIWGGLVRIFLVHHVTWSVNSVCHIWGSRPFDSHDESRNNLVFGVLAMGEGWHNNHHAFPSSARHGLRWWQLDVSYVIIWCMSKIGLASDVKVPSAARLAAKQQSGA